MTAFKALLRASALAAACAAAPQCWAGAVLLAQVELPSVARPARPRPAPVRIVQAPKPEARPAWAELAPPQQQALGPLAGTWRTLTAAHKRKWLALASSFAGLPPTEQARLHSRMAEWAALSPQERTRARFNFADAQKLPAGDKKAKWEAYQALPAEEKRRLAAGAAAAKPTAPPTAAAVQPAPQKLARTPKSRKSNGREPEIATVPNQIDHNTLLPQPGASSTLP